MKIHNVEEFPVAKMYESGQVSMAVTDANGQPWVAWETERGDLVARSYLTDDEQYACEPIVALAWPLTVLAPAIDPDDEALVEKVARAGFVADNPGRRSAASEWDNLTMIPPAYESYRTIARAAIAAMGGAR